MVSALAARVPSGAAAPDTVRYIPCPQCRKLMNRVNFSKTSGVIMDVCKADGVWLDRGELERVVGFIEHGGLTIAREREREQLADEQRRLTAREAGFASRSADVGVINIGSSTHGSSPGSPIDQLLRDALGLFIS